MSGPFDPSWLSGHLPPAAAPTDATSVLTPQQILQRRQRTIGPAQPLGTTQAVPESWIGQMLSQTGHFDPKSPAGTLASLIPPIFAAQSGATAAQQVGAGKYGAAALSAAVPLVPLDEVPGVGRVIKGAGKALQSLAGGAAEDAAPVARQVFEHYSNADLSGGVLDPKYMGTGKPGLEKRVPFVTKTNHVYVAGTEPEAQFKNLPKYDVHVAGSIYDIADDPLGLWAKAVKDADNQTGALAHPAVLFEKRLAAKANSLGIAGYVNTSLDDPFNNTVKLFGKHPVTPAGVPFGEVLPTSGRVRLPAGAGASASEAPSTRTGLDDAADVLKQFQQQSGAVNLPRVKAVDPAAAAHMAKLYDALPKNDPAAKSAYDALNAEVDKQFQAIKDAGHTIEFTDTDPYKTSKEMIADVRDNKRLRVFKTPDDSFHPYMTPEQNDKFRAVHDWLAHAGEGHSFGPVGEENAYRVHSSTLSPLAQQALATETRGQNSWVNFGPNAHLPPAQRPFAEQKAALWPKEFTGDYGDMNLAPFYSRTQQAIQTAPFAKGTAEQWAAHIGKNSAAGEREWTGVAPFLQQNAGKVLTREQVAGAMQPIQLGERTLGEGDRSAMMNELESLNTQRAHLEDDSPEYEANWRRAQELNGQLAKTNIAPFGDYTEPGGTNYRVKLVTLPQVVPPRNPLTSEEAARLNTLSQKMRANGNLAPDEMTTWRQLKDRRDADQALLNAVPDFNTSHFPGEPNILTHLRMKDRELAPSPETIADIEQRLLGAVRAKSPASLGSGAPAVAVKKGIITPVEAAQWSRARGMNSGFTDGATEKVLHLEELQSDWHQQGRSKGYSGDNDPNIAYLTAQRDAAYKNYTDAAVRYHMGDIDGPTMQAAFDAHKQANDALKAAREGSGFTPGGVPNAPFKKTEDWQLLGLKHAIHDAVHGGYDRLAWTPGDLQNARYDLSKQVNRVEYDPTSGIFGALQDGQYVHTGKYRPEELPDVIGKDPARRLLAAPPDEEGHGMRSLNGEQLALGGDGMKGFYDKMLPNNLKGYLKKLGVTPPEVEHIAVSKPAKSSDAAFQAMIDAKGITSKMPLTLPSIKITPELRRAVLTKGQPLWATLPFIGAGALAGISGSEQVPEKRR